MFAIYAYQSLAAGENADIICWEKAYVPKISFVACQKGLDNRDGKV